MDLLQTCGAPTPSAAAELATPNRDDLLLDLDRQRARMTGLLSASLAENGRDLERLQSALRVVTPGKQIAMAQRDVAEGRLRLARVVGLKIERRRDRLASATKALESASPEHILARGYALVPPRGGAAHPRRRRRSARNQRFKRYNIKRDRIESGSTRVMDDIAGLSYEKPL